jgi:hypothetical protein
LVCVISPVGGAEFISVTISPKRRSSWFDKRKFGSGVGTITLGSGEKFGIKAYAVTQGGADDRSKSFVVSCGSHEWVEV